LFDTVPDISARRFRNIWDGRCGLLRGGEPVPILILGWVTACDIAVNLSLESIIDLVRGEGKLVYIRDALYGECVCQALSAPYPAFTAHRGIVVEIVQKDEPLRRGVLFGDTPPPIDGKRGPPFPGGGSPKTLIVAAFFFYDKNH